VLSRWLFLRLLGAVYLIAFVSLWPQIDGLIGSHGILPAAEYLDAAHAQLGSRAYWQLPGLCWFDSSDTMLHGLCAAGTVFSVLLILGVAPIPVLILLWMMYLSLSVVGQTFLGFQWDTLLLETGFFAIFLAPRTLLPGLSRENEPPAIARWMLWWLLLKLMFLSGVTKLLSGDPAWRQLTALDFHFETQPIPNWLSWYAHQLPSWVQMISVALTFIVEMIVPLFIFAPRYFRYAAFTSLVLFQVLIQLTGNFGFFNLLAITLCVLLLDDRLLRRLAPRRWTMALDRPHFQRPSLAGDWPRRIVVIVPAVVLLLASGLTFLREMVRTQNPATLPAAVVWALNASNRYALSWAEPYILDWIGPFRTINGYGLFRVMTTERPEIVIEGSRDGVNWIEYQFAWKPGGVTRPPRFVAPHQPRLDWQMWFAALNPRGSQYWLVSLLRRLLEGSPEVVGLLAENPFPDQPPRYVRLVYYRYHFTDRPTRRITGQWWQRSNLGPLTPPVSLTSS
jgi:hypothetical protein